MTVRIQYATDGESDGWIDVNNELWNQIVSHAMDNDMKVSEAAASFLGDAEAVEGVER